MTTPTNPLESPRCVLCDVPVSFAAAYVAGKKHNVCSFCVEALAMVVGEAMGADEEDFFETLRDANEAAAKAWRAAFTTPELVEVANAKPAETVQ